MAHRWGTDPEKLRHSLTDSQFKSYVEQQFEALAREMYMDAVGTAHSIAHVLGTKDALSHYFAQLNGEKRDAGSSNDTAEMSEIRRRINEGVRSGAIQ